MSEFRLNYGDDPRLDRCESPIEQMMFDGLSSCRVIFDTQVEIDRFRVDFLVDRRLIVECDGEDFHYATDAQRLRDLLRDRHLMRVTGFRVLRFQGTRIYRELSRCLNEIAGALVGVG